MEGRPSRAHGHGSTSCPRNLLARLTGAIYNGDASALGTAQVSGMIFGHYLFGPTVKRNFLSRKRSVNAAGALIGDGSRRVIAPG